ncbi:hypothetical protein I5Q34_29630 [Streptomyces sp. AV19]|uniref:hypothetical protein n=1 Tax=Streptomyces sp. AV19 TaxID=2793068 RepID=UPI0018FE42BB|nr:hypothetical protein [Streptomyces sp. AV19]MBH1938370.1 hypothetical protein [Streptomyces sp. AV19]MDG4535019.1 hypothetical protein [Streptomyces sp. AV19]
MTLRAAAFLGVLSKPSATSAQESARSADGEPAAGRTGFFDDVVNSGMDALEAWKLEAAETVASVIALSKVAEQRS